MLTYLQRYSEEVVENLIHKVCSEITPKGPINNIPALIQKMAWGWPSNKPLSEAMMVRLPTNICSHLPYLAAIGIKVKSLIRTPIDVYNDIKGTYSQFSIVFIEQGALICMEGLHHWYINAVLFDSIKFHLIKCLEGRHLDKIFWSGMHTKFSFFNSGGSSSAPWRCQPDLSTTLIWQKIVQCSAFITRSIFSQIFTKGTP